MITPAGSTRADQIDALAGEDDRGTGIARGGSGGIAGAFVLTGFQQRRLAPVPGVAEPVGQCPAGIVLRPVIAARKAQVMKPHPIR